MTDVVRDLLRRLLADYLAEIRRNQRLLGGPFTQWDPNELPLVREAKRLLEPGE